jgi:hypothetical protein
VDLAAAALENLRVDTQPMPDNQEVLAAEAVVRTAVMAVAAAEIQEVIHLQKVILAAKAEQAQPEVLEAAVAAAEVLLVQDLELLAHM